MKTIIHNFTVLMEGESLTDIVEDINISMSIGGLYNTATIAIASEIPRIYLKREFTISYGNILFSGVCIDAEKKPKNKATIYLRSQGSKLLSPFVANKEVYEVEVDTDSLIQRYSNETGVTIENRLPNVVFDGTFKRNGTQGDAILSISKLFKADIYDTGMKIVIEEAKWVNGIPTEIVDGEFGRDTLTEKSTIESDGLKRVIIKSSSKEDIESTDIVADIYEDGEINVFTNDEDFERIGEDTRGIILPFTNGSNEYTEVHYLDDDDYFRTRRPIDSVIDLTLNGANLDGWQWKKGNRDVSYPTPISGRAVITYSSKYKKSFVKRTEVGSEFGTDYNKDYGGDYGNDLESLIDLDIIIDENHLSYVGVLKKKSGKNGNGANGSFAYEVEGEPCYEKGFKLITYGETPLFQIYNGANKLSIGGKITSVAVVKRKKCDLHLRKKGDVYVADIEFPVSVAIGVRSGKQGLIATDWELKEEDGQQFIEFSAYHPSCDLLYDTNGVEHSVQYSIVSDYTQTLICTALKQPYEIIMADSSDCSEGDMECSYPAHYTFVIDELLGVPLDKTVGVVIDDLGTVNGWGEVTKEFLRDGIYKYDTSSIKPRTNIKFKANANGSLE